MKLHELLKELEFCDPNAEVVIFDAEESQTVDFDVHVVDPLERIDLNTKYWD